MFSKVNPLLGGARIRAPQLSTAQPEINLVEVRREILLFYDRWTRTDSGGFLRYLKTCIAILEDLDTIANMTTILPGASGSVWFTCDIEEKCSDRLRMKFQAALKNMDECLRVHLVTRDAVVKYKKMVSEKTGSSRTADEVVMYLDAMESGMTLLLDSRRKIIEKIKSAHPPISFGNFFEELSVFLLIVAETTDDFIPYTASSELISKCVAWRVPRTLEEVREDDGRNLFLANLDD
jgi:hypothetical protein